MRRLAGLMAMLAVAAAPAAPIAEERQVIAVPGFGDFLAVDGASVWMTNRGRVERWSGKGKLAEVAMTRPCGAIAIAAGALWVADCKEGTLNRIDLKTARLLATIPTGVANPKGEMNVVAGAGSIWIANDDAGTIARIDPRENKVVASIRVDPGTYFLAFGLKSLWAVSSRGQSLQKIDPRTNTVAKRVALGSQPGFLAAGEGGVFVQEQGDGTVVRVDPATAAVTGRVRVGADLLYGDIDTGGGLVWLRTTADQTAVAIDPKTLAIVARLGKASGSGALRFASGGFWTTAHDLHTLNRWSIAGGRGPTPTP